MIERGARDAGVTLDDVDAVAVTHGPGLIGALLVGVSAAKALAWARGLPLIPVDHLHGHVASLYLQPRPSSRLPCLLASGGHSCCSTSRTRGGFDVLGTTLDDAAGEAFDKGARLLGLGYPGGAAIDRLAREGDPEAYAFPVARVPGPRLLVLRVKTALLYAVRELARRARTRAAPTSRQATSGRSSGARRAGRGRPGAERVAVVGGVAANSELGQRCRARRSRRSPLHRQRGDDRLGRPLPRARAVPGYLSLDARARVARLGSLVAVARRPR